MSTGLRFRGFRGLDVQGVAVCAGEVRAIASTLVTDSETNPCGFFQNVLYSIGAMVYIAEPMGLMIRSFSGLGDRQMELRCVWDKILQHQARQALKSLTDSHDIFTKGLFRYFG